MIFGSLIHPSRKAYLKKSISFAKEPQHTHNENIRIIDHCQKCLLFNENEPWEKKETESSWDVTISDYYRAKICELVKIYILTLLARILRGAIVEFIKMTVY